MKEYGKVRIGHVNGNVTELEEAKVVRREVVGYDPEEGSIKEYEIEYKSGNRTRFYGCWADTER